MSKDDENKNQALAKYDPILAGDFEEYLWLRRLIKKRDELRESIEKGLVHDPISAILITVAISAAVSAASYALTYFLTPKPKPQRVGALTGNVQVQNSEKGLFIPEIYGGAPVAEVNEGVVPTYQNVVNATVGAGGAIAKNIGGNAWNSHATSTAFIPAGMDGRIRAICGSGPFAIGFSLIPNPAGSGGTVITDLMFGLLCNIFSWPSSASGNFLQDMNFGFHSGSADIGTWFPGDEVTVERRNGRIRAYKGEMELAITNPPSEDGIIWPCVFMFKNGAGPTAVDIITDGDLGDTPNQGVGGCKVPAIIIYTSGLRKHEQQVQQQQQSGGKGSGSRSQTVIQVSYDLDIANMWGRGMLDIIRLYANADILYQADPNSAAASGVYDPSIPEDAAYTTDTLPDTNIAYNVPKQRISGELVELDIGEPTDGGDGGPIQGGQSDIAIYPGSFVQLQDPTIQAAIDTQYGSDSTPAYRGRAYTVHTRFNLDRWQGLVPNFTGVWQHRTIRTLGAIFTHFCEREGVLLVDDYDFSSITDIFVRGLLVSGARYVPAAIMDSPELQAMFNYFTTEGEGKILAFENGDEPSVTIPASDFGWLDGDGDIPDIIQKIGVTRARESGLPKEIDFKFIDPGDDWDINLQPAKRRIVSGQETKTIELNVTALPDEARVAAERTLYNEYKRATSYKFHLPWTYLYLYPGYRITTTTAQGFTYVFRLTAITGGIGVLECEGIALELDVFNQPNVPIGPPVYNPGQIIPTQTVALPLNLPAIRPQDQRKGGYYIGGRARVADGQSYTGYVLWMQQGTEWSRVRTIQGLSIVGKVVSATGLSTDPDTTDMVGEIVVDLYGNGTLSSITEADMIAGGNRAAFGNLISGFASAVQDPDEFNRWTLTVLRNGQNFTAPYILSDLVDKPFAILDDTIQFIPLEDFQLNTALTLKAVTFGQSLADAAEITFTCTGESLRPFPIIGSDFSQDGSDDWQIIAEGDPDSNEEPVTFVAELWTDETRNNPVNHKGSLLLAKGSSSAALLEGSDYTAGIIVVDSIATLIQRSWADKNNIYGPDTPGQEFFLATARTIETITQTGTILDMTFHGTSGTAAETGDTGGNRGHASFGLGSATLSPSSSVPDWRVSFAVQKNTDGEVIFVQEYGVLKKVITGPLDYEMRFTLMLSGGEIRLYRNRRGVNDEPIYVTTIAPEPFPMRAFFTCGWKTAITGINIYSSKARAIYAARDQVRDFGSVQSRLYLRIYQSPFLPNGPIGFARDFVVPPL